MGAIFGSALGRAGESVVFYDNRPEVIDAIRRDGARLTGVLGDLVFRTAATGDPRDIGDIDLALIVVDSGATADVAAIAAECLPPDGFALTLQNGIGNWEALAAVLGKGRVMAGSTFNSGAGLRPGLTAHTNLGPTVMGEVSGPVSERARRLAGQFEKAGLPFELSDAVEGHVWSKFVHNCAINPVSAVTGLRGGEIARTPAAARLLDAVLDEVLAVVASAGVRLPEDDPRGHIHDHCWERYNRPSMLQHLESGRRTEIDALNGALVGRARALGVPVPVNETIVNIVKGLEAAGGRQARVLNEAALEREAAAEPRNGRWG
jgi:2-dehydropantoate 2-reductase